MNLPGAAGFRHVDERVVHRGHVWHTVVATFAAPDGSSFQRDIVRSPGAVAVVPIIETESGPEVALVAQYRPAFDAVVVEVPAGMRDVDGEPTDATARRELAEEVGLDAASLHLLTEMLPSVGLTDSVTTIYVATGCRPVERAPHGPEEDHAEIRRLPLADAVADVVAGRLVDAKTVIGLLLAERWWASSRDDLAGARE